MHAEAAGQSLYGRSLKEGGEGVLPALPCCFSPLACIGDEIVEAPAATLDHEVTLRMEMIVLGSWVRKTEGAWTLGDRGTTVPA